MDRDYELNAHRVLEMYYNDRWRFIDDPRRFRCGVCGAVVTPHLGLRKTWSETVPEISHPQSREVRICPDCQYATTFADDSQFPRPLPGERFNSQGKEENVVVILALYNEARCAVSGRGPSCAVLMYRKLLMHIAVQQGASKGQRFIQYCDFLKQEGVVGKPQHAVLDRIRHAGNEENHEVHRATNREASDLLALVTVLIKTIYFMG